MNGVTYDSNGDPINGSVFSDSTQPYITNYTQPAQQAQLVDSDGNFIDSAAQAQQSAVRSQVNTGKANTYTSSREAAQAYGSSQKNSILDYLSSFKNQQQGIDNKKINAELGRQRGSQGILDMIGRGVRSGAAMLNARNAGASSAGEAIGRAYGDLGRSQQSSVNNQYAMANRNIGQEQDALVQGRSDFNRNVNAGREAKVNEIAASARNALLTLNDQLVGAGLSDRIAIEQEKEAIRNEALQALAGLDADLGQVNSVSGLGDDAVREQAGSMNRAGQAGGDMFNFTQEAPLLQQGGPQYSDLPLYSYRRSSRTA